MPTYDYVCGGCGHRFDVYQSITADVLKKCPACAKRSLQRLIGTGGGIIFKGSGFHETDYRSESYKKGAAAEKSATTPASDGKAAETKKTEPAPAKTESKKPSKGSAEACKVG
jgi:putative FmdB family regulatory protein